MNQQPFKNISKVAITGSNGFIGRHVVRALREILPKIKLVLVVRSGGEIENDSENSGVVVADIYDESINFMELLGNPDALVHLAWGGLSNFSNSNHEAIELPKQKVFLTRLIERGLAHLVVAGTCFEYGAIEGECREEADVSPILPYGRAKNDLRITLESICETGGCTLAWARLFYMYGAGQRSSALHAQFVAAAVAERETFDMSDGEQVRDYLPVEDVAQMLADCVMFGHNVGVVNICSGRPTRVVDMIGEWSKELNYHPLLNCGVFARPAYEPDSFWGSRKRFDTLVRGNVEGC